MSVSGQNPWGGVEQPGVCETSAAVTQIQLISEFKATEPLTLQAW